LAEKARIERFINQSIYGAKGYYDVVNNDDKKSIA
jgi:hypothetical protein